MGYSEVPKGRGVDHDGRALGGSIESKRKAVTGLSRGQSPHDLGFRSRVLWVALTLGAY